MAVGWKADDLNGLLSDTRRARPNNERRLLDLACVMVPFGMKLRKSFVNSTKKLNKVNEYLDPRALRSILAARPVNSISQLASLHYVAKKALSSLRNAS